MYAASFGNGCDGKRDQIISSVKFIIVYKCLETVCVELGFEKRSILHLTTYMCIEFITNLINLFIRILFTVIFTITLQIVYFGYE